MALDLPASPSIGQIYTSGGTSWIWDGQKWNAVSSLVQQPIGDNKLINGFLDIDQRNEGAASTNGTYSADGWHLSNTGSATYVLQRVANGPPGMPYSIQMSISAAASSVAAGDCYQMYHSIEGAELIDTRFGTSSAQPLTFSFWAFCTVAGTYCGSLHNDTQNRDYVFSFTLPAGVWTLINQTILGDVTGTWVTSGNGVGAYLFVVPAAGSNSFGVAGWQAGTSQTRVVSSITNTFPLTAGARFQLGPCKLELGSVATPMVRQSFQQELARCQRYFEKSHAQGTRPGASVANQCNCWLNPIPNGAQGRYWDFKVPKRANATITFYDGVGTTGSWSYYTAGGGWVNGWSGAGTFSLQTYTMNGFVTTMPAGPSAQFYEFDFTAEAGI